MSTHNRIHIYICMYICILHMYTHNRIHIYLNQTSSIVNEDQLLTNYIHTYIHIHTYNSIYSCAHIYIFLTMFVYIYTKRTRRTMTNHLQTAYTYIHIQTLYICTYMHAYMYIHTWPYMYIHANRTSWIADEVKLPTKLYIYIHIHTCTHIYVYVYAYVHIHLTIYVYICIYISKQDKVNSGRRQTTDHLPPKTYAPSSPAGSPYISTYITHTRTRGHIRIHTY